MPFFVCYYKLRLLLAVQLFPSHVTTSDEKRDYLYVSLTAKNVRHFGSFYNLAPVVVTGFDVYFSTILHTVKSKFSILRISLVV